MSRPKAAVIQIKRVISRPKSLCCLKYKSMDKIKEKLDKLRIESDSNLSRAEKAEADVKQLKESLSRQETLVQTLNNKVSLISDELERAEKRAEEHKQKKAENDKVR